ncbi:MAG TPA: OmpH family outer membrane protein [Rhodocyclaceae bacterium]
MSPISRILLLSAALAISGNVSAAELKVGVVRLDRLLRDAPVAVAAQKRIESEFSAREQEVVKLEKQLKSTQENYEKNAITLSESERRAKERDINDMAREVARRQREFREDLDLRRNEALKEVIARADQAIKKIAEAEKFDLILQDAVFVSQRLDITDKVIKALGEAKEGGK